LIGSLRNEKVPETANILEAEGFEAFDSWFSPGPEADDFWRKYEKARGRTYAQALKSYAGQHVFEFDKYHIDRCDIGVLLMPAGKSGHLEFGYMLGTGKPGFILFEEEPERWDVMYQFATGIFFSLEDLLKELENLK
jgi:nucleoside 2-deoxyribosyltransferase